MVKTLNPLKKFGWWRSGGKEGAAVPIAGTIIGSPFNVQHTTHVQPDPHTSTGFSVSCYITRIDCPLQAKVGRDDQSPCAILGD
eukprot:39532-Eustigmatos_ZCMA.PRE.1